MAVNKFTYHRDGLDLIPQRSVWLALARLVADGCCYFRHQVRDRVASEPSAYAPCKSPDNNNTNCNTNTNMLRPALAVHVHAQHAAPRGRGWARSNALYEG